MINLNYYPYLYFLIAVFATSVNAVVVAEYDNYMDLVPPNPSEVRFIDVNEPLHPSNLCKNRLNISDGEWREYHQEIIPSNICAKYITCMGTGYNNIEFGAAPSEGVRCQRVTQNQNYNFGYGCYDGRCVPITCLDHRCWSLLEQSRKTRQWRLSSRDEHSPLSNAFVQLENERTPLYPLYSQSSIGFPHFYIQYRKSLTNAPHPNPVSGIPSTGNKIIYFNLTGSENGL